MLKFKVEFEIDEENLQDIFESYNVKFTKKKVAELKKNIKENMEISGDFIADALQSDFENVIGEFIGENFEEDLK
jgi:hypothetical protein